MNDIKVNGDTSEVKVSPPMKKSIALWEIYLPDDRRVWRTEHTLHRTVAWGVDRTRRGVNSIWDDFRMYMDVRGRLWNRKNVPRVSPGEQSAFLCTRQNAAAVRE